MCTYDLFLVVVDKFGSEGKRGGTDTDNELDNLSYCQILLPPYVDLRGVGGCVGGCVGGERRDNESGVRDARAAWGRKARPIQMVTETE